MIHTSITYLTNQPTLLVGSANTFSNKDSSIVRVSYSAKQTVHFHFSFFFEHDMDKKASDKEAAFKLIGPFGTGNVPTPLGVRCL
jgi:hypothetical protein